MIARIAVSAAIYQIDRPYDYLIPPELEAVALPGIRVVVPFGAGNRSSEGIILALTEKSDYDTAKLKYISGVLDAEPLLTPLQLKLAVFISERFFCTVYSAVKAMLPAGLWFSESGKRRVNDKMVEYAVLSLPADEAADGADRMRRKAPKRAEVLDLVCCFGALPSTEILHFTGAGRAVLKALEKEGFLALEKREVFRRPEVYAGETLSLPELSEEQEHVFAGLRKLSHSATAQAALLFGVTGSGKTSVYMRLIADVLEKGKTAILLVPEIALTPQMLTTFSARFGDRIAVLHSSLSMGERYDEWKRIKNGAAQLVIGTRSAIFAPLENLGLIIIDEEQEESYKSENSPRYHAHVIAKYLCAKNNSLLLFGSATPDITSMYQAQTGRYHLFALTERYNEQRLPQVEIVDMREEVKAGRSGNISRRLAEELALNLQRGEQSILFINRRGANKLITCGECGFVFECPRCSVSLTYHSATGRLLCHHCGYSRRLTQACPECGGILNHVGAGTQLVEEEVQRLFPGTEVIRVDTDTVTPAGSHEVLFERFRKNNVPVMVGTQMVSKGLNFENVTLVGVISADQSLYSGDYRAGERTFSLITQVVGRSGRGTKPGRALIQTFTPKNETILQAAAQDYPGFFESEIRMRKLQNAPPFGDIFSVTAIGKDETQVLRCCMQLRDWLKDRLAPYAETTILGPVPLTVARVNNRFRYRVNIVCRADASVRNRIASVVRAASSDRLFKGITVFAAADPYD